MNALWQFIRSGKFIGNFVSLVFLQASNYVIPVFLLPLLIQLLGKEQYGRYVYIQSVIYFINIVVEYGYNITGTRDISQNKSSALRLSVVFNRIVYAKFFLSFCSFACLLVFLVFFAGPGDTPLYMLYFLYCVFQIFIPLWFFNGIQEMKFFTAINFISKLLFIVSIVLIQRYPNDLFLVVLLEILSFAVAGIVSMYVVFTRYKIVLLRPDLHKILRDLRGEFAVFISRVQVMLYSTFNIIVLGGLSTNLSVANYSIADKTFKGLNGLLNPISMAVFPIQSNLYLKDYTLYKRRSLQIVLGVFAITLLSGIASYAFSSYIIHFLSRATNEDSVQIMRALTVAIIFGPFGGIFTNMLVIEKDYKYLNKVLFLTMIVNLALLVPCIKLYDAIGLAYVFSITRVFVFCVMFYKIFLRK